MDYELAFGKAHTKKTKSKLNKKMLDSMSLKKLKVLAKKHKVSCYKKGTKVCVKKSTLLKRLKKSRSVNKILESALKMKRKSTKKSTKKSPKRKTVRKSPKRKTVRKSPKRSQKRNKYGNLNQIPPNYPNFYTPLELALGQTYEHQLKHYKKIPSTLISTNFQGPASSANGRPNEVPHNFKFTRGSLGRSSLPSYEHVSDPKWRTSYPNKFGQYFR